LAERGELAQLLKEVPDHTLTKKQAKFVIAELVDTLDYLHKNGVGHRDLKPENVFLNSEGHLKLGDFGTAYISEVALNKFNIKDHKKKQEQTEECD